ncbi:MAG: serine hydrolase [Steroidobacteraceae bacterium]|jgi:CubicO group peptidase (beta-lactamase class C family)
MSASCCCKNRLDPLLALMFTLSALGATTPGSPALAAASSGAMVGEHIQHIRGALLPAVLIQGERGRATTLSDRMASLHVPGVSIAVIHDGKLEWARGFGVSKIGGPAVTPNTLFQAASISKPVTALGVLHLVQVGKLDLDVDVNQYLKTWKIPANSFTDQKAVTLRELLTHTAGMTVHGFLGYAGAASLPNMEQILDGLPPANSPAIRVDVLPGTIWRYSGGGYVVVQQLLEDVTGESFAKLMQDMVLNRIGMTHSTYTQPLPKSRLAEIAMPYGAGGAPIKGGPHVYPEMAPAGLWTTPSDLARFAMEIQRSWQGKANPALSTSMTRQMLAAGINNWGLGLHIGGSQQHPLFEHNGANEGYRCDLVAYTVGDGAIIMTNGDNGGQLAQELRRTIAHEYGWPHFQPKLHKVIKVDPARFDLLTGSYQLEANVFLTISREGDHLFSQATAQGQTEIFAEGDHEYFSKMVDARITFDTDDQGRATKLVLHQDDRDQPATRLDDAAARPIAEALSAINKRFKNQTPAPESESALRQLISDVSAGTPHYDRMTPEMATLTRQQLGQLQPLLKNLGAVQSVILKEVAPDGADVYTVRFANGTAECGLSLQGEGIISGAEIFNIEK